MTIAIPTPHATAERDRREVTHVGAVVGGEVGADGDERELPERELTGPAGEHRRRHRDHQEDEHGRVLDEPAREVLELGDQETDGEEQRDAAVANGARERMLEQLGLARAGPWREGPRRLVGLRPCAEEHQDHEQDEHHEQVGARIFGRSWRAPRGRRRRARRHPTIASGNDSMPPTSAAVSA